MSCPSAGVKWPKRQCFGDEAMRIYREMLGKIRSHIFYGSFSALRHAGNTHRSSPLANDVFLGVVVVVVGSGSTIVTW